MFQEFEFYFLRRESGYRYSLKNCLYESVLDKIYSNCSCIPDLYRNKNDSLAEVISFELSAGWKGEGQHDTEVSFALLTQLSWIRILQL